MTLPPSHSPQPARKRRAAKRRAAAVAIAEADLGVLVRADKGREAALKVAAELIGDATKTLRAAVLGQPPYRRPSMRAVEYVFRFARMLDMPGNQVLAIIQREVGVDLADAKLAVSVWQDSRTLGEEAKREVAEEFLARHYNLPVGVLRDALQRACGARVGDNGGGEGS